MRGALVHALRRQGFYVSNAREDEGAATLQAQRLLQVVLCGSPALMHPAARGGPGGLVAALPAERIPDHRGLTYP